MSGYPFTHVNICLFNGIRECFAFHKYPVNYAQPNAIKKILSDESDGKEQGRSVLRKGLILYTGYLLLLIVPVVFMVTIRMPPSITSRVIIRVFLPFDVMMIADHYLLPIIAFVSSISFPVNFAMPVRSGFVHHYLISPVHIILPVPFRYTPPKYPSPPILLIYLPPA